ncbi:MAG: hypothetical protein FD124_2480 [Alphaproteobacteria bacterium]|nr:MAG: hypothetical protein FD160_2921 [Caulobacteraceae bacterium]TPW04691.1 MAG: hypothetical protein FD124_2480 [Alphaproteobacteria bacterium]
MGGYEDAILQCLAVGDRKVALDELEIQCARLTGAALDLPAFGAAISELVATGDLKREGQAVRRVEPDAAEVELEAHLVRHLESDFTSGLGVTNDDRVVENTARGGTVGSGRWSRPDATLAVVRSWRFDPRRQLDVFSFELKNRAGSNILAVHEALAHARFAHFPYLVCPRPSRTEHGHRVRQECAEHGVGLIHFSIHYRAGTLSVDGWAHDLEAVRHNPDPSRVDQYLSERLTLRAQDKLEQLARGGR